VDCASDRDCMSGWLCLSGSCRLASVTCGVDGDCTADQICQAGTCIEACKTSIDCPAAHWCDAGHCLPGCGSDSDCPNDQACEPGDHQCRDRLCIEDEDCPTGLLCTDGACRTPECLVDADCEEDEQCRQGACAPAGSCSEDGDCLSGQLCIEGFCITGACRSDGDCVAGQVCNDGICEEQGGCTSDLDCPDGQHCLDQSCTLAECLRDEHCPGEQVCVVGDCQEPPECVVDGDCPGGQCIAGQCVPDTSCDPILQDCRLTDKCTVGEAGWTCAAAGDGTACLAGSTDDCPAGDLCTGYGDAYACHDICATATSAGCSSGHDCSALDGLDGYGTCQCDPMQESCPTGDRCNFDPGNTPVCMPAGDGGGCYGQGLDDCPPGQLCATEGSFWACYHICVYATNAGCLPSVDCYTIGEVPTWGVCLPACDPLAQNCPAGQKCMLYVDGPGCSSEVGTGSSCRAVVSDDCPLGQYCSGVDSVYDCHDFCHIHSGLGCSSGTCSPLLDEEDWGVCQDSRLGFNPSRLKIKH